MKDLMEELKLTFLQAMDFTIQSYVKQRVESEPGEGTTFFFTFME